MLSELFEKKLRKYIVMGVAGMIFSIILLTPILALAGIVAQPLTTISQMFSGIADWSFDDGSDSSELVTMIQDALKSQEIRKAVNEDYSEILNDSKVSIPTHYIVVPQLLMGIEYKTMKENYLEHLIEIATQCKVVEEIEKCTLTNTQDYAVLLKEKEPFKTGLSLITSSQLVKILDGVGSVDYGTSIDPDILAQYKDKLIYPFKKKYPVGDGIGSYNPSGHQIEKHNGLDIQASCGTSTFAIGSGIVTEVGINHPLRGNYIFWTDGETEYRYLHFISPVQYRVGQKIEKGQYVGSVGTTGYSFGCHLHIEIRIDGDVYDPRQFIDFDNPIL